MFYRIIYRITYWVEPNRPGVAFCGLNIALVRDGNADKCNANGRPRPPVARTIDLRIGDEILFNDQWRKIVEIDVHTDRWFTDEELPWYEEHRGDGGYIYRPKNQPTSLPLPARIGSKRTSEMFD